MQHVPFVLLDLDRQGLGLHDRPDEDNWPYCVKGEQAEPAGEMDGFLLVMVAFFRDLIRDIVDVNECVDDERYSDDQCPKSEVIEEHGHAFCPLGSRAGHLGRHTALDSPFGGHSETAAIPPDLDAR